MERERIKKCTLIGQVFIFCISLSNLFISHLSCMPYILGQPKHHGLDPHSCAVHKYSLDWLDYFALFLYSLILRIVTHPDCSSRTVRFQFVVACYLLLIMAELPSIPRAFSSGIFLYEQLSTAFFSLYLSLILKVSCYFSFHLFMKRDPLDPLPFFAGSIIIYGSPQTLTMWLTLPRSNLQ